MSISIGAYRLGVGTLVFVAMPAFCGDWNPRLAAQYLDSRQKQWFAWPPAGASGVPCVSCHTGLPYLLARPALRQALGETGPTLYEAVLLDGLRATIVKTEAKDLFPGVKGRLADQVYGAQVVLSTLLLAFDDAPRGSLTPEGEKAFERMWSTQIREGRAKGSWNWSDFNLDPWETPNASFYGAALAALATGIAPANYQARPQIRENVAELVSYLRNAQQGQPLHNRLILLWASAKLYHVLAPAERQVILEDVWRKQQADGGWTLEALGPWRAHPDAPPASGSNSYATGLVAFTLEQAGVHRSDAPMSRALAWLEAHQDRQSGSWAAESMNRRHEAGSMPAQFMSDAATSYATLALLPGEQTTKKLTDPRH
jgi:squalene-hopene/tetraprenyl-beta-curcumene cyclase